MNKSSKLKNWPTAYKRNENNHTHYFYGTAARRREHGIISAKQLMQRIR